jgi:hypothetical protein
MKKDVHLWFELTRANYLVLPRSLMEGMPLDWQEKFTALLDEMRETFEPVDDNYSVYLRDENGKFKKDIYANYRHPAVLPYRKEGTP